jgi:hypothetical protein
MNLNVDRIAPSPQPSPAMGAREKTLNGVRFDTQGGIVPR